MVKDLRLLTVLGIAAISFTFILVVRVLLIRKEGFADKPPTPKQIEFIHEAGSIPWLLTIFTDESSPTSKIIQQAAAIGKGSTENTKFEDINYSKVINTIKNKYNEDRAASTAYKVFKGFKYPTHYEEEYRTADKYNAAINSIVLEGLKKLHKKMPSYPFSKHGIDILKMESQKKIPKMDECKKFFKCSGIEKIPKSLD